MGTYSIITTALVTAIASGSAERCGAEEIIWDHGPGAGGYSGCWSNDTEGQNFADDVAFENDMALTGIDVFTYYTGVPLGEYRVKIFLDDGQGNPGNLIAQSDNEATRVTMEGQAFKHSLDIEPVLLSANTVYWIGAAAIGWELGQTSLRDPHPDDGMMASFTRDEFRFHSDVGDQTFRLRGSRSCPPDFDGDVIVSFRDLLTILSAWGDGGGVEDLDQSGVVDFGDLLLLLAAWGPCPSGAVPANHCEDAPVASDGSYAYSTVIATTDGPDLPDGCDEGAGLRLLKDVWITYTASCTGVAVASVCNSDFDTRLAVYEPGDCLGPIIACNDDACGENGTRSEVSFATNYGEQYLIRIGSRNATGGGVLLVECGG